MLKHSRGWIVVSTALLLLTTLPVRVLAQDTTLPDTESDGRQRKPRINGKVVRDSDGIPHITASTEREVIYLQGFTHAQDRLFQMDFLRRQADGTLAELLGSGALPSDVQLRTFGLRRAAERSLPILSRNVRDALSAYADGVNDYVARNPLPPEYATLEITTFRPWEPVDSLSILRVISFGLSFELTDLDRTTLLGQYQAAGAAGGFDGTALFFEDVNRLAPFQQCGHGAGCRRIALELEQHGAGPGRGLRPVQHRQYQCRESGGIARHERSGADGIGEGLSRASAIAAVRAVGAEGARR